MPWSSFDASRVRDAATLGGFLGWRVRARTTLHLNEFSGSEMALGAPLTIQAGRIGFLGHPVRDSVVVAFPDGAVQPGDRLETLRFGHFRSILVNMPTLRHQFDLEAR
ncbi:hypothetical protein [Rubellimicrobium arenae]|uniref:hypothetical protein n=1 Tax=Rubellimicrobium arenae TaxID=2817372 RepID=UPI001B30648B|nr:hypothetical protein [Rubellimicrobium arenae]